MTIIYCVIAFVLGWIFARQMGNGFSVGGALESCAGRDRATSSTQNDKGQTTPLSCKDYSSLFTTCKDYYQQLPPTAADKAEGRKIGKSYKCVDANSVFQGCRQGTQCGT